jgi:ParB/RepB/Spo0J family partition protein
MPKATPETTTTEAAVSSNELLTLTLDQIILDPITDVRTGSVAKDEEQKLDSLARTLYEQGQLQPVVVRPNGQPGKYLLIAGRRRFAAAHIIEEKSKQPFPLRAMLVHKSDDEAYAAAIQENLARRQFSPVELAQQIKQIRERLGLTGTDWSKGVAEFLHVSRATVTQHAKLLDLPAKIQAKVHSGLLSAQSAFDLAAIETSQQEAVLQQAEAMADQEAKAKPAKAAKTAQGGKNDASTDATAADSTETSKIKRKHILAAAREVGETTKPRTRNEILAFFSQVLESADSYSDPIYKFCDILVNKWATGTVSDRSMLNRLNDLNEICEDKAAKTAKAPKTAKKAAK